MNFDKAESLHLKSMELAEQSFEAKLRGESKRAANLLKKAFASEREAADIVALHLKLEPTRAILHRSAASMALECGESRIAEQLIARALSGDPPNDIAEELRDLLEQVHFTRHLNLQGIALDPSEFQLSISGPAVGHGIADSEQFVERVHTAKLLLQRTAERTLKKPYRERGPAHTSLTQNLELYISVPRAASFAVTLRIGSPSQFSLPHMPAPLGESVIEDVVECLDVLNKSGERELRKRIKDEAYHRNFVALARRMSPDGSDIKVVGITALIEGKERRVMMTTTRYDYPVLPQDANRNTPNDEKSDVLRGTLKFADSTKERAGVIQVIDEQQTKHRITVPLGMMSDIVRPLYEREVVVTLSRTGSSRMLETIQPVEKELTAHNRSPKKPRGSKR